MNVLLGNKRLAVCAALFVFTLVTVFNNSYARDSNISTMLPGGSKDSIEILQRYISIDNVCAWPNISRLKDGSLIATIYNKPAHGRMQGDVECWVSNDGGKFWTKRGTPAPHEPMTNRMNVAAGLANNGDLIVIASGWALKKSAKQDGLFDLTGIIAPWVSRSADGGKNWKINKKDAFPKADPGFTGYIPFGDILKAADGSLRVIAYNQSNDKAINTVSVFKSTDDGKSWKWFSRISDGIATAFAGGHNETAFFHTGDRKWIAAARRWKAGQAMDLFISEDDGKTWKLSGPLTSDNQHPSHLMRLKSGELLLTFGNRTSGKNGVAVKISKDNGNTWEQERFLITDLKSGDCGYPASVEMEDGSISTVYYSNGTAAHSRYHMGTIIWKFK